MPVKNGSPILLICKKRAWQKHETYENMEYSYNLYNSKDHQLYLQGSSLPGTYLRLGPIIQPIPHRTPVALFWDLFRGLHLTSWRWMACRRINYPHDLLGVSETLQPDYPRIPPDHGWSTFSTMTHYLQLSSTFLDSLSSIIFNFYGLASPPSIVVDILYAIQPLAVWWGIST